MTRTDVTRTVVHDTFVIERSFPASPARVFLAFADPKAKIRWFGEPDAAVPAPHEIDFRVGGRESLSGDAPGDGPHFTYDAVYQDIVDNERIVYSYDMTMDGRRISVSVATLEFLSEANGTRLILTEQGVFLDGLDTNAIREQGTRELLEALAQYLEADAA
jgi:uncharacterized protein YndB with AHSA1/START domain